MIKTTTKNKMRYVTSSYFEDLRILKQSQYDTDYRDLKRNSNLDTNKLQQAYIVQQMILSRKGILEMNDYVSKLSKSELDTVTTVYPKFITDQPIEDLVT